MITAFTVAGAIGGAVLARATYRLGGRRADWLLLALWVAAVAASLGLRSYGAVSRLAAGATVGMALVTVGYTAVRRARRSWGSSGPAER